MKLDLDKYRVNRKYIQEEYRRGNEKSVTKVISSIGAGIHCPLLALAFFLAETETYSPELVKMIDSLIKFYGYTEISGLPKDSPYFVDKK